MEKTVENKKDKQIGKSFSKKKIVIIVFVLILLVAGITMFVLSRDNDNNNEYSNETPKQQEENTTTETLMLKENLNIEINSELDLLSLIDEANKVEILSTNTAIDTSKLGEQEQVIKYIVNNKEEEKTFTIKIVDTIAPTIEYNEELSTTVGAKIDLLNDVKVSDNSKEEITATVEGEYSFDSEGTYNLKYVAVDSSNNKAEEEFILKVNKKTTTSNNASTNNSSNNNASSSNKKPNSGSNGSTQSNNNQNNSNDIDNDDAEGDYLHLEHEDLTSNSVVIKIVNGAEKATGYEFYVYTENGKLFKKYDTNKRSYKVTGLNYHTVYYYDAKAYVTENNKKKYISEDSSRNSIYTLVDDKLYSNEVFKTINKMNNNRFKRDTKLDAAVLTCAKKYHDDIITKKSSNVTADYCLKQHGISTSSVFSSKFVYIAHPGVLCANGTSCSTDISFTYIPLSEISKDSSFINSYYHVGAAYYKGVAAAVYVSYCDEVDTTGLNVSVCQ